MLIYQEKIQKLTSQIAEILTKNNQKIAVAESCTGGGLAYALTSVSGSSGWFDRGFVVYSNQAKREILGVEEAAILDHGAVSEEVAIEMAEGAVDHSDAQVAISITGIAGPNGGSEEKPVGTVCFGLIVEDQGRIYRECFDGDRASVREQSVVFALEKLHCMLCDKPES